jgi:hypothetical protein
LDSAKAISLTESESWTEEIAAETDSMAPRSWLETMYVDKLEMLHKDNGLLSSAPSQSLEPKSDLWQLKTLGSISQELKFGLELDQWLEQLDHHLQEGTIFHQTLRLVSILAQLNNLPTMMEESTLPTGLSRVQANSTTPQEELVNGGKLDSAKATSLTESESWTEEIAAEIDSMAPRSWLETKYVDKLETPHKDNGLLSSAQNQSLELRSDL